VPETPTGKINTTDPDSRLLKAPDIGYVHGYNAQAAVNDTQIVFAAEISVDSPDFGHLEPMVDATVAELRRAGVAEQPRWRWRTPATGTTTSRWTTSPPMASRS
jgi:hypothetical protein